MMDPLYFSIVFTLSVGAVLLLASLLPMGWFMGANKFPVWGRTVVITGGSQGMGKALAKQLAERGANIVIVARTLSVLDTALKEVQACASNPKSQKFLRLAADLTKPKECERMIDEVMAWNNGQAPDVVWANAGASKPGLFLDYEIEELKEQMDVNYWMAANTAHAILKKWTQPSPSRFPDSPRHLIITSSVLAFLGMVGYVPYSPAKSALKSLCDTLRSEMNLYNGARHAPGSKTKGNPEINVHCVCPATIFTPGYEQENKTKHKVTKMMEEDDKGQTEDEVASKSIAGLEKGDYLIVTNSLGMIMRALSMGGSARNGWGIWDSTLGGFMNWAALFILPDLERKVFKWGRKNGVYGSD